MRDAFFSLFLLMFPVFPSGGLSTQALIPEQLATPAGIILPRPKIAETFSRNPTPLIIRVTNYGNKTLYLQGMRQSGSEGRLQIFFYHRGEGRGWKPYFDSLPCNLPTCRNLHSAHGQCGKMEPYVIRLGPSGTYNSVKEFRWGGLLYQRNEAIREARQHRYCYKGWVPKRGRVRVEVEYSKSISRNEERKEMMAGRDHTAIEFNLPVSRAVYEIGVGG